MVKPAGKGGLVDFSFMPSLQCDLECVHCMYESSPLNTAELDLEKTRVFVGTIDWDQINACGFYGGEPGIRLDLYSKFIELIPPSVPCFTITNGTWSRSSKRTEEFMGWVLEHGLQVFISSTRWHLSHQNRPVLWRLSKLLPGRFILKDDDEVIPMGRAAQVDWTCSRRCERWEGPVRFALKPGGAIIFQNCDGVYPVVGTYREPFQRVLDLYEGIAGTCRDEQLADAWEHRETDR